MEQYYYSLEECLQDDQNELQTVLSLLVFCFVKRRSEIISLVALELENVSLFSAFIQDRRRFIVWVIRSTNPIAL